MVLQEFEIWDFSYDPEIFLPIAQGLIDSKSITDIKIVDCRGVRVEADEAAAACIRSILESKSNLRSLSVRGRLFVRVQPMLDTFVNLLRRVDVAAILGALRRQLGICRTRDNGCQ